MTADSSQQLVYAARSLALNTRTMSNSSTQNRTALLAGATGAVGRHLLAKLLADDRYTEVHVLSRRPIAAAESKLHVHEIDFERLDKYAALFDVDDVFCCLGTTMKQAGSREAFRRVDHDYVVRLAQLANEGGAQRFLMISAVGAHPKSMFFYSRVKGETEQEVMAAGPHIVHILRPSLLLGERKEHRPGEEISKQIMPLFNPLLGGPLKKYRGIQAEAVAQKLLDLALHGGSGQQVHHCF